MGEVPAEGNEAQSPPVSHTTGPWQNLPRLGAVGLGVLYVAGVLIVNIDLGRYGVVNLDLARPEYLLAGGLWAFMVLVVSITIHVSLDSAKQWYAARGWHAWPALLLYTVILLGSPFGLLLLVSLKRFLTSPSWDLLLIPYAVYWNALGILWFFRRATRAWQDESLTAFLKLFDFVGFFTFLLGGLTIYATQVYPVIPKYLGGGDKPIVQIVLSETPKLDWSVVGGLKGENGKTVGPVELLSETGAMFIIRHFDPGTERTFFRESKTHPAIGVNKKLVSAVVYFEGRR